MNIAEIVMNKREADTSKYEILIANQVLRYVEQSKKSLSKIESRKIIYPKKTMHWKHIIECLVIIKDFILKKFLYSFNAESKIKYSK